MIKKILKILFILLFLDFGLFKTSQLIPSIKNTYKSVKTEPKDETYITDEKRYLKTYYLMKKGNNYYFAHYQAFEAVNGGEENIWKKDAWGWRLPLIFYFWKHFTKSGVGIINLFIIISSAALIVSYFIAKKLINAKLALLAPLMLFPYFLNAILSTSFMFITWWASFFFIFGLCFFYYKKFFFACFFFCLTVLSRELFIIPIFFMFIISLFYKRNRIIFLVPILLLLCYLPIHTSKISNLVKLDSNFEVINRLSSFKKDSLLTTLAFSTNSYLLVSLRPTLIWLISSLIGLSYYYLQTKNKYFVLITLASFLPLFLSFSIIGQSRWEDYWGPLYVPIIAIFSLTLIRILDENFKKN